MSLLERGTGPPEQNGILRLLDRLHDKSLPSIGHSGGRKLIRNGGELVVTLFETSVKGSVNGFWSENGPEF